jgi:L-asparagine transporter-like permease
MRAEKHDRRLNEGLTLLAAHLALLAAGVVIQVLLATNVSGGIFATAYGFVLVYALVVATTIGYAAVAVRARHKPMATRYKYLIFYHLGANLLMAFLLFVIVLAGVAVPPEPPALD